MRFLEHEVVPLFILNHDISHWRLAAVKHMAFIGNGVELFKKLAMLANLHCLESQQQLLDFDLAQELTVCCLCLSLSLTMGINKGFCQFSRWAIQDGACPDQALFWCHCAYHNFISAFKAQVGHDNAEPCDWELIPEDNTDSYEDESARHHLKYEQQELPYTDAVSRRCMLCLNRLQSCHLDTVWVFQHFPERCRLAATLLI